MSLRCLGVFALLCLQASLLHAACCAPAPPPSMTSTAPPPVAQGSPGSTAFCLFEVPNDDGGRRKWVNLGIVQYLELGRSDLRIYYGGGNFGGGYETRIPVGSQTEGLLLLDRLRQTAANCSK